MGAAMNLFIKIGLDMGLVCGGFAIGFILGVVYSKEAARIKKGNDKS